jgi:hypothetical protein
LFGPKHGAELWVYIGATAAAFVAVFAVLHWLPVRFKRWLVVVCAFLGGLFYSLEYYLPAKHRWFPGGENPLSPLVIPMGNAVAVISGFALALGLINLGLVHGRTIARARPGWYNSVAFFVALISMIVFGLWQSYVPDAARAAGLGLSGRQVHRVYDVLFNGLFQPLGATLFSVLAFYIASAAFRAFRIRTAEAAFMMVSAFIVMLGQVPVGQWLTQGLPSSTGNPLHYLRVENAANWLYSTWSMAGVRAVDFGIAVGALAMALRVWLSLERGSFFEVRESKK